MNKKQNLYCNGQADQKNQESEKCVVKFLKTKSNNDKSNIPHCVDKWPVPVSDIVSKLPKPVPSGKNEVTSFNQFFKHKNGINFSVF